MDASTSAGGAAGITRALGRSTGDIEKTKKSTHTQLHFSMKMNLFVKELSYPAYNEDY